MCGKTPATQITVRRHQGMLLMQRFFKARPTLCRACGEGILRNWTGKTLVQGWWGYVSFFVNWFVLAANLAAWLKLRRLERPTLSQL